MVEQVTMRSPEGEIREVDATPEALTPLMAAGWHQIPTVPTERPPGPVHPEEAK
jgi:hypothetical protein